MEKFEISFKTNKGIRHFEVKDYMHHDANSCKYEVFENGRFVASFEPDSYKHLHVCQEAGILQGNMLDVLATELERYGI